MEEKRRELDTVVKTEEEEKGRERESSERKGKKEKKWKRN